MVSKYFLMMGDLGIPSHIRISYRIDVDAKILIKILPRIQQYIKGIIQHVQIRFISGMQDWLKPINIIHHINRVEEKNYMILPIGEEKSFGKIQHPTKTKRCCKLVIERKFLSLLKIIYKNLTDSKCQV